jgi:hypothetical protein
MQTKVTSKNASGPSPEAVENPRIESINPRAEHTPGALATLPNSACGSNSTVIG